MNNRIKTLITAGLILMALILCQCAAYADYGFDTKEKADYGFVKASEHYDYTTIKKIGSPLGCGVYYYNGFYYYGSLCYDSVYYYPQYLNGAIVPVFLPRNAAPVVVNHNPAPFSNNAVNNSGFENNVINSNGFENNVITNGE